MVAKLFAVREGPNLAWEKGFRHVILESDSMIGVQLLKQGTNAWQPLSYVHLISDCLTLLEKTRWFN
ncbi:hypothetical protein Syun_011533 [Stephania yunnanensis]|uniref:RNase H type-1 domain-containing protein n=1 Tax=Stephania yunnanensis TaxID=152371 RepID=A0AAP0PEG3_9MAGN